MQYFYAHSIQDNTLLLDEEETRHCTQVLRHKTGDILNITDGKGNRYTAKITLLKKNSCEAEILSKDSEIEKRKHRIHIAIAPTKNNERFEWFLEKATELGIDEITPILCEHSERRVFKLDRMKKVLVAALKQSGRVVLPQLNELISLNTFIQNSKADIKLIASMDSSENIAQQLKQNCEVLVLIGPEGDFSLTEIETSIQNGFSKTSLGDFRLRTETAALSACFYINYHNELTSHSTQHKP